MAFYLQGSVSLPDMSQTNPFDLSRQLDSLPPQLPPEFQSPGRQPSQADGEQHLQFPRDCQQLLQQQQQHQHQQQQQQQQQPHHVQYNADDMQLDSRPLQPLRKLPNLKMLQQQLEAQQCTDIQMQTAAVALQSLYSGGLPSLSQLASMDLQNVMGPADKVSCLASPNVLAVHVAS